MSARYAGEETDDRSNLAKLLSEMQGVEEDGRGARFVCYIALAFPDGREEIFKGIAKGRIGRKPRGSKGFGYDPVFYPEGHAKTFAEMTADEKNALSHRGKALRKFKEYMARLVHE